MTNPTPTLTATRHAGDMSDMACRRRAVKVTAMVARLDADHPGAMVAVVPTTDEGWDDLAARAGHGVPSLRTIAVVTDLLAHRTAHTHDDPFAGL